MSYVYDLILNFNNELFDFYEWLKNDIIYHIKRIPLIKVDSSIYNDILSNYVMFNDEFMLSIFNRCEYYNSRVVDTINYAFLLTDNYRVMGIILDNNGKIVKYSSLLLDEEEDILNVSSKLGNVKLNYKVIKEKDNSSFYTRQEKNIIKFIKKDLTIDYHKKDINKLRYLYYEYFNRQTDDIDLIYHDLLDELEKDISEKHYKLYNLIKLSYGRKTVKF